MRDDGDAHVLLVDRSRQGAKTPLFYPDLEAQVAHAAQSGQRCQMALSLRDCLVEKTGDRHWPHLVNDRVLSRRILHNLPRTLRAHEQLRQVSESRFTDTDLHKIVLGAMLGINPWRKPTPSEPLDTARESQQTQPPLDHDSGETPMSTSGVPVQQPES